MISPSPAPRETWFVDCEWGFLGGRVDMESAFEPVVFCAVGSRSSERLSFWGWEDGLGEFLDAHRADLFVSHNNVAEMKYVLRAGLRLPDRWFDTYVGWRLQTNQPGHIGAGLLAILDQLGLPHQTRAKKEEMQQKILHLRFGPADRQAIREYCLEDCVDCGLVYEEIRDRIDRIVMVNSTKYLAAVSRMELRGVPVDTETARQIHVHASDICEFLAARVNEVAPIYRGLVFNRRAFLRWAAGEGIAWPWKRSKTTGRPVQSLDNETLKLMEARHPAIAVVRQVKKTLNSLQRRSVRIDGRNNRHYFSTWPFRSITGRNQPRDFIYCGPKWMRHLIVPEDPDHALVYLDAVSEEIGIAAALSGDQAMRTMYESEDAHMAFAIMAGAAPAGATKATHGKVRKVYKTVSLGVLYGLSEYGIAERLGVDREEARALLSKHLELFPTYWSWSKETVESALRSGEVKTRMGWRCTVPSDTGSRDTRTWRTWMNWPIQAAGGDLMRLVVTYLDQQGVRVLAPVHDGFLLSCHRGQLEELDGAVKAATDLACDQAIRYRLKWDKEVFSGRYEEEDGAPLWNIIMQALVALRRR